MRMIKRKYKKGEFVKGSIVKVNFVGEVVAQYGDFVDVDILIKNKKDVIINKITDTFRFDDISVY